MIDPRMLRIAVAVLMAHLAMAAAVMIFGRTHGIELLPITVSFEQDGSRQPRVRAEAALAPSTPQRTVSKPSLSAPPRPSLATETAPVSQPAIAAESSQGKRETASDSSAAVRSEGPQDREPVVDASFAGNRLPEYPPMSRRMGEQGTVALRVLIGSDGAASDVRLVRSSGSARLDHSAIEAVRQWRFVPALKGGKPISSWYEWQWEFRLQ